MTAEAVAASPSGALSPTVGSRVADAGAKIKQVLPKVGAMVSKGVYNGSYCLSYGVVFPTLFLCHVIPGGVSLATGIRDGVAAANDYVRELRTQPGRTEPLAADSATATA